MALADNLMLNKSLSWYFKGHCSELVQQKFLTRSHDEGESDVVKEDSADPEKDVGQADQHEEHQPDPDDQVHLFVGQDRICGKVTFINSFFNRPLSPFPPT